MLESEKNAITLFTKFEGLFTANMESSIYTQKS
jgi:hypothetical protein